MAAQATIESQTGGNATEVTELPDIAKEQAALAASTKAETQQTEQAVEKEEGYTPKVEGDVDEVFDINEFYKQKNTADKGVKAEVKPEAKTEEVEEPVVVTKPGPKPLERVVDDIDEPLRPHFKKMSNEAFNALKPVIAEAKKVKEEKAQLEQALAAAKKGGLPDSYYEHEMAYVLTPEFAQKSNDAQMAASVLEHWRTQFAKVRGGENEYVPLVQDAQGRLTLGQPVPVDRNTEAMLAEYHQWANQQYLNAQAKLSALSETHKERAGQFKSWLSSMEEQAFPHISKNDQLKASVTDTVRQFHPALQANPAAGLLARAFITINMLGEEVKKLKGAGGTQAKTVVAAKRQPTAAEIAGGGSGKAARPASSVEYEEGEEDLMAQFKAAKGR